MIDSPDIGKVVLVGPCGAECGVPPAYTENVATALTQKHPSTEVLIVATTVTGAATPPRSRFCTSLPVRDREAYPRVADFLNRPNLGVDVVALQHSFDLFGGPDRDEILSFLQLLTIPVVTTLHQVAPRPSRCQVLLTRRILDQSDRVIVTHPDHLDRLRTNYGADPDLIDVIETSISAPEMRQRAAMRLIQGATGFSPVQSLSRTSPSASGPGDPLRALGEAYNHSFLRAIARAHPPRSQQRMHPWPWARMREFAVGTGCQPGWDS